MKTFETILSDNNIHVMLSKYPKLSDKENYLEKNPNMRVFDNLCDLEKNEIYSQFFSQFFTSIESTLNNPKYNDNSNELILDGKYKFFCTCQEFPRFTLYQTTPFNNNAHSYSKEVEERPKTINLYLKNIVTLKKQIVELCEWLNREKLWELDVKEKQAQATLKKETFRTETVEALKIAFPNGTYVEHQNYFYTDEKNSLCIHIKDDNVKVEIYNTKMTFNQNIKLAKVMQLVIEE
jgi:hypothetical protein